MIMREIKFRGKRLDNGEWIVGNLITYESSQCAIMCKQFTKIGYEATEIARRIEVNPATVGQYTGLKDRNGREIYEGDVMRFITEFGEAITSEVAFMDGFFHVQGEEDDDIYGITYVVESMNAEIIGNIHDNPELLNQE